MLKLNKDGLVSPRLLTDVLLGSGPGQLVTFIDYFSLSFFKPLLCFLNQRGGKKKRKNFPQESSIFSYINLPPQSRLIKVHMPGKTTPQHDVAITDDVEVSLILGLLYACLPFNVKCLVILSTQYWELLSKSSVVVSSDQRT